MSALRRLIAAVILGGAAGPFLQAGALNSGEMLARAVDVQGSAPSRTYTYEEIGNVAPGGKLALDRIGRIGLVREGSYLVFDDKNWTDISDKTDQHRNVTRVACGPDGRMYCAGAGYWGYLEYKPDGLARVHSARGPNCPAWLDNDICEFIAFTSHGVAFGGHYGIVYWDLTTDRQLFAEVSESACMFTIGDDVFLSAYSGKLYCLHTATGEFQEVTGLTHKEYYFLRASTWDEHHALVATNRQELFLFDGQHLEKWAANAQPLFAAGVTQIHALDSDLVAITARPNRLAILDRQGNTVMAADDPRFADVTDICASEKGLVWVCAEEGVTKLVYDSPIQSFDHRTGLALDWPQVIYHHGVPVVISQGRLYAGQPGAEGGLPKFVQVPVDIPEGISAGASTPNGLLLSTNSGVYAQAKEGGFTKVADGMAVDALQYLDAPKEVCVVIGATQIAGLKWIHDRWEETGKRITGLGFPSVITQIGGQSIWLELGINRVGRISVDADGQVQTRIFDQFPWADRSWVNLGAVGKTVVLSSGNKDAPRLYIDDETEAPCAAPELEEVLKSAPFPVLRPHRDSHGAIWATHARGVFRLRPANGRYETDVDAFYGAQLRYPTIGMIDGHDDIWLRGQQSVVRVRSHPDEFKTKRPQPVLTRVVDARTQREVYNALVPGSGGLQRLPYSQNSLDFHFFPNTYRSPRSAYYQYRLKGYADDWTAPIGDTIIALARLHEGKYAMSVRLIDEGDIVGEESTIIFSIDPPFYRTWLAFLAYALALVSTIVLISRWFSRRAKERTSHLEELVAARTKELNRMMVEARQAAEAKSRFLANMSHEIRTPMNGVIGMSNLLMDMNLTGEMRECTSTIRNSAEALLTVLNDILDFSKIEAGKLELEKLPFDIRETVEESLSLLAIKAADNPVEMASFIAPTVPSLIIGDPARVRQVLMNLIGNAVKFTERGEITVTVTAEPEPGGNRTKLRIEVRDTGIGISPEVQALLFRPFNQADSSTTRRFGGTGLGLAISREIVELMGGRIGVFSKAGEGSTFWATVPFPVPPAAEEAPKPNGLAGRRLLGCGLSALTKRVLEQHVTHFGATIVFKDDVEAGTKLCETGPVDVVILEATSAGVEALARRCAVRAGAMSVPVIVLKANSLQMLDPTVERLGRVVVKPIRELALRRALGEVLGSKRGADATAIQPVDEPLFGEALQALVRPLRVLVAEDNEVNRRVIEMQLKKCGCSPEFAENGAMALAALGRARYDLVFMDCQMPEMDGYEATRQIRRSGRSEGVRIVAMTANALEGDREKCIAAGMDDYLTKPVREADLRAALERALRKRARH